MQHTRLRIDHESRKFALKLYQTAISGTMSRL